jgi:hypothetical protein
MRFTQFGHQVPRRNSSTTVERWIKSCNRISIGAPIALNSFAAESEKLGAESPIFKVSLFRAIQKDSKSAAEDEQ